MQNTKQKSNYAHHVTICLELTRNAFGAGYAAVFHGPFAHWSLAFADSALPGLCRCPSSAGKELGLLPVPLCRLCISVHLLVYS